MMAKLAMGELESAVMDVLWADAEWLTPGDVHAALSDDRHLAYTTVMTILVRLWQKGRVDRRRDGRAYAYHPVKTKAEHVSGRMREILASADDRGTTLGHFVKSLGPTERAQLRRILARRRTQ